MQLPSRGFKDKAHLITSENYDELIKQTTLFHPFVHCIEIATTNPHTESIPLSKEYWHVLLDYQALRNEAVVNDLLEPTTRFCSLSPIDTGNGMFVHHGTIMFVLNQATYERFGLSGRKYRNQHLVIIQAGDKHLLNRIQAFQPIEGVIMSSNIDVYEQYLLKFKNMQQMIEDWSPTEPFAFEEKELRNDQWRGIFLSALDRMLMPRNSIILESNTMKMKVEGFIDLSELREWLSNLGSEGSTLVTIWDMEDIPGSYIGKKGTLEGLGGGFEALFYGKEQHAIRYQICLYCNQ